MTVIIIIIIIYATGVYMYIGFVIVTHSNEFYEACLSFVEHVLIARDWCVCVCVCLSGYNQYSGRERALSRV